MKINAAFLKLQLEYSRWASERTLDAARPLTQEELERDLHNSHGGVLGTLTHVFQSDRIWLSRLRGTPRFTLGDTDESLRIENLGEEWSRVADGFQEWLAGTKDFKAILDYTNLAGQRHRLPLWQVVLHVVNHATYHRGQITTMLRQLGYSPIATDLHVFYLTRPPEA